MVIEGKSTLAHHNPPTHTSPPTPQKKLSETVGALRLKFASRKPKVILLNEAEGV